MTVLRHPVRGPFDLAFQNGFFNGWPTVPDEPEAIVQAFPVEETWEPAAVVLRQEGSELVGDVAAGDPARAFAQGLAAVSADIDGAGWPALGERDPLVGGLQREYRWMRPSLFHSPYEAAAAFIIGHRISIVQTRRIRQRIAEQHGERIEIAGTAVSAFPAPERLLDIDAIPGVAPVKVERLHGVARAALDGLLDRAALRALPEGDALARLQAIAGVGPFFAQGILFRGAGIVDGITTDAMSLEVVRDAFDRPGIPDPATAIALSAAWSPYRMWVMTLLHVHSRAR